MITPSEARKFFPHTASGKIYFNHAAISPLSTRVTASLGKYFADRQAGSIDTYVVSLCDLERTRVLVAELIGARDPHRVAFVDNTGRSNQSFNERA